jgi:hypothetical protein
MSETRDEYRAGGIVFGPCARCGALPPVMPPDYAAGPDCDCWALRLLEVEGRTPEDARRELERRWKRPVRTGPHPEDHAEPGFDHRYIEATRYPAPVGPVYGVAQVPMSAAVAVAQGYEERLQQAHQRIAELEAERDALAEIKLRRLEIEQGRMKGEARSWLVPIFAGALAEVFDESGGVNFVEWEVMHPDKGPLVMTMQRKWGKTPAQLKTEVEGELETARAMLTDAIASRRDLADELAIARAGNEQLREALELGVKEISEWPCLHGYHVDFLHGYVLNTMRAALDRAKKGGEG